MTEWQLDNGSERFLAGMMVRKNQKETDNHLRQHTFPTAVSERDKGILTAQVKGFIINFNGIIVIIQI